MSVPFPDPASDDDTPARLLAEADTRDNLSSRSPSGDGLSSRSPSGDGAPILSVSQLSAAIQRAGEDGFARVRVRGERACPKRAASGRLLAVLSDYNALPVQEIG